VVRSSWSWSGRLRSSPPVGGRFSGVDATLCGGCILLGWLCVIDICWDIFSSIAFARSECKYKGNRRQRTTQIQPRSARQCYTVLIRTTYSTTRKNFPAIKWLMPNPKHRPQCLKRKNKSLTTLTKRRNDASFSSSPCLDPLLTFRSANDSRVHFGAHPASAPSSMSSMQGQLLVGHCWG
jgi:hypothetical protein